jgi:endonuclease YncB( thermonuclease family)
MKRGKHTLALFLIAFSIMAMHEKLIASEITSFAFVQEDGSLRVAGRKIYLYGIYIPPTEQSCYTFIQPMPCAPRAVLALEFKISGDFVHCFPRVENPDGSLIASCSLDNEDLSAWMLQRGWAVARPDAPFEYAALERIARSRGIGIWGIPIDTIPQRR